jgi:hypothetical protein
MSFFKVNGRRATRSGWREPAVVPGRECGGRNVISPQKPIADASANPTHGGLTPAALDSAVGVRRTLFAAPCKRELPTHGGLTPAALAGVRYCASYIGRFVTERTSRTGSGWREPAVVPGRECAGRNVISPQKPIADASANPTHGGLTPAALGDVRLYSGNVVFQSERTSCNQERLALASRGAGKRMCGAKRNQSAKTDRRCKRESDPRRADTRRSWKTCVCTARISFFKANGRRATRSGSRKPAVVPGRGCAGRNVISPQKPIADASVNPTHGGLTPAALGCMSASRRTLPNFHGTAFVSHTTAG